MGPLIINHREVLRKHTSEL